MIHTEFLTSHVFTELWFSYHFIMLFSTVNHINHVYCEFIQIYLFSSCMFSFNSLLISPLLILSSLALQHRAKQFKSLAPGQNVSDISQCNSFISLFLSGSTCCHLRKLRRDYCSWPTQTWDHWSLRWTNYTAGCRHFCFCCGSTLIRRLSSLLSSFSFHPLSTSFLEHNEMGKI